MQTFEERAAINPIRAIISDNIAILLAEKRMTQAELANRAGITKSLVSQIMLCKRTPRTSTLQKVADALEVPMADLAKVRREK